MDPEDIVIRPIITERSNELMAQNKYTFQVAKEATKPEIARAVEKLFNVKVVRVTTMNYRGKMRRQGKTRGYRPDWKKAIVQIAPGKRIELFEGV